MLHLLDQFKVFVPHADTCASLTNMGKPSRLWPARCGIEHLQPYQADQFLDDVATYVRDRADRGEDALGPLNVRSFGAALAIYDFDFKHESPDVEDMIQIADLFARVARQHFSVKSHHVILARSSKGNYHLHLPGFVYTETNVPLLLLRFVKAKATVEQAAILECVDTGPIAMKHMRLHGTDGAAMLGESVYTVVYPASGVTNLALLSVRPTHAQLMDLAKNGPTMPLSIDAHFFCGEQEPRCSFTPAAVFKVHDLDPERFPHVTLLFQSAQIMSVLDRKSKKCETCSIGGQTSEVYGLATYLGQAPDAHGRSVGRLRTYYFCDFCNMCVKTEIKYSVQDMQNPTMEKPKYMLDAYSRNLAFASRIGVSSLMDLPLSILAYDKGLSPVRFNKDSGKFTCPVLKSEFRTATAESCHMTYSRMVTEMCELNETRAADMVHEVVAKTSDPGNCCDLFDSYLGDILSKRDEASQKILVAAAPCGAGKTVMALRMIEWLRIGQRKKVLVLAPRTSLVDSLYTKLGTLPTGVEGEVETVHHCKDGYNKHWDVAVSTLESAEKVVSDPQTRRLTKYQIVVADEFCELISGLFTQPTYKGPLSRRSAIRILLLILANAENIIFLDKDIGMCERMFVALVVAQRCFGPGRVHSRIWELHIEREPKIKFVRLKDEAAAVNLAIKSLAEGEKVALFEPSVRRCLAMTAAVEAAGLGVKCVTIHGTSPLKEACARDPDKFCDDVKVDFFAYTGALGVGVSIDGVAVQQLTASQDDTEGQQQQGVVPARFSKLIVCTMDFYDVRRTHQGMWRIRRLGNDSPGQKTIYIVEGHLTADLMVLRSAPTIADAYSQFGLALKQKRKEVADFAFLADDDPVLAALRLRKCALSVVAAAVRGREWFIRCMHKTMHEHSLVDSGSEIVLAEVESTKEERRNLKRLRENDVERTLTKAAPVQSGDDATTVRRKVQALTDLGIGGAGWSTLDGTGLYENERFMRLAETGVIRVGNIDRLLAFVVGDGHAVDSYRLNKRTETAPMTQLDDDTGPVVARELAIINKIMQSCGLTLTRLVDPETDVTEARVTENGGNIMEMDELRENWALLRQINWRRYKGIPVTTKMKSLSFVRYLVNAYFGFKLVGEERKQHGKIDVGVLSVMLSLLPKYVEQMGVPLVLPAEVAAAQEAATAYLEGEEVAEVNQSDAIEAVEVTPSPDAF